MMKLKLNDGKGKIKILTGSFFSGKDEMKMMDLLHEEKVNPLFTVKGEWMCRLVSGCNTFQPYRKTLFF